jgi:threonine dehydrogenase-like Zn-dependent dehydrogenase
MRATVMYGAGDVRVEKVPDARLVEPTDALVAVSRAAICGGDLWPYNQMEPSETGRRMGHEAKCVGTGRAMLTAIGIARPGGAVGRVGVPHYEAIPASEPAFFNNLTVSGGPAPVRAYIEELLPDVLEGRIEPGRVFDRVSSLDEVPDGYRAMNEREAIKVMVKP